MSSSAHIMILGPTGGTGAAGGDCPAEFINSGCLDGICGATFGATGATGATGHTGATGPRGRAGVGFGYCGPTGPQITIINDDGTETITTATYDARYYRYAGLCGDSLVLFLATGSTGGGYTLEVPGKIGVGHPRIQNGVIADIRGATGTTGPTGPVKIETVGSGVSILFSNIFEDGSNLGPTVEFKTLFSNGDAEIQVFDNTIYISGLAADAPDGIDMGITGEIIYMRGETYADGAADTFWNASTGTGWPIPTSYEDDPAAGASAYHEALTARLIDHREIIKRHGNQRGFTAYPVGYAEATQTDVNLKLEHGNIQKVYCGLTTGHIYLPTDGATPTGRTHDVVQNFTLILHNAGNHGLLTGENPEHDVHRHILGSDGGDKTPIFPEYHQNGNWNDTKFSSAETGSIDILHFIRKPISSTEAKWYAINPSLGFKESSEFSYNADEVGACCDESFFLNGGNGCVDYTLAKDCLELENSTFHPETLCRDTSCVGNDGACCTMGTCIQATHYDCEEVGGYFVNDASCDDPSWSCNDYPCNCATPPTGACCYENSENDCIDCIQMTENQCTNLGNLSDDFNATFRGIYTECGVNTCGNSTCAEWGACCYMDSECKSETLCNYTTPETCSVLGGIYHGNESECCSLVPIPQKKEKWLGCYCKNGGVNCIWGDTYNDVRNNIAAFNISEECWNILLWNPSDGDFTYPDDGWVPCFASQLDENGNLIPNPACTQGICANCDDCNCASLIDSKPLGRCCFPFAIPVVNLNGQSITVNCLPDYDEDSCYASGGVDWEQGAACPEGGCDTPEVPECIDCDESRVCCVGGKCVKATSEEECDVIGGEFHPDVSSCENIDCCIDQSGACCLSTGCVQEHPYKCAVLGGIFQGIGTDCNNLEIDCCVDDVVKLGACCCESCECVDNAESAACTSSEECGNCTWYQEKSCDLICDYEPECPNCPQGNNRISWHIFVSTGDAFGGEKRVWGGYDEGDTVHEFGPAITRENDGFWNTYGWYSYSGAWSQVQAPQAERMFWFNNPYTGLHRLIANIEGQEACHNQTLMTITTNDWGTIGIQDENNGTHYVSERGLVSHAILRPGETIWEDDNSDWLFWDITGLDTPFYYSYIPSLNEMAFVNNQMNQSPALNVALSNSGFSGKYWTSSTPKGENYSTTAYTYYLGIGGLVEDRLVIENNTANPPANENKSRKFVRVMETQQLPFNIEGDLEIGQSYGSGLIYAGEFTPGCSRIYDGQAGGEVCSNPLPSGPCCNCKNCSEVSNSYTCLHKGTDRYWPWESTDVEHGYMWRGDKFDTENMTSFGGAVCDVDCDTVIENNIKWEVTEADDTLVTYSPAIACTDATLDLDNSSNQNTYFQHLLPTGTCCKGDGTCPESKKCDCDGYKWEPVTDLGGDCFATCGEPPVEPNCCDDNDDGTSDYWCLDCPGGNCSGCFSGTSNGDLDLNSYSGCRSIYSASGVNAIIANETTFDTTNPGVMKKDTTNPVDLNPYEASGCPCTEKVSLRDCLEDQDNPDCDVKCCEWHGHTDGDYDWNGNNIYNDNFPNPINYPFSEVPGRNPTSGRDYVKPTESLSDKDVGLCPTWSFETDGTINTWPGSNLPYGGWNDSNSCNADGYSDNEYSAFVSGTAFDSFSYRCTPYSGILQSGDTDWWTVDADGDGTFDSWEIPVGNNAINPSYARKFKLSYQTNNAKDHVQVIQLPWPKGAKDENEAWSRVRCYLNSIRTGICNSQVDPMVNGDLHSWLNGFIIDDHSQDSSVIKQSNDSVKFLGYAPSEHWVLYDSGCVNTTESAPNNGANGEVEVETGTYSVCVPYNYTACPLRIDEKQIRSHHFATPRENEINERIKEGYGPGGQGPLPAIVINFNDCDNSGSSTDWYARVSECGGRSCLFGPDSTISIGSKPSSVCEILEDAYGGQLPPGIQSPCSDEASFRRDSCKTGLDSEGNIKGYCACDNNQIGYLSAKECSEYSTASSVTCNWISDNIDTRIDDSLCDCDCSDCLYPNPSLNADGTGDDLDYLENEKYYPSSCCMCMGENGWPGNVGQPLTLPFSNLTGSYASWNDFFGTSSDDWSSSNYKGPDLVGWLCGWNSIAHQFAKDPQVWLTDQGCWAKTFRNCLDVTTCPALFGVYEWSGSVDEGCYSPGTHGNFCNGEFITDVMKLNTPLDCEGCQLGSISMSDGEPARSIDNTQGNDLTGRNLRGVPKRNEICSLSSAPPPDDDDSRAYGACFAHDPEQFICCRSNNTGDSSCGYNYNVCTNPNINFFEYKEDGSVQSINSGRFEQGWGFVEYSCPDGYEPRSYFGSAGNTSFPPFVDFWNDYRSASRWDYNKDPRSQEYLKPDGTYRSDSLPAVYLPYDIQRVCFDEWTPYGTNIPQFMTREMCESKYNPNLQGLDGINRSEEFRPIFFEDAQINGACARHGVADLGNEEGDFRTKCEPIYEGIACSTPMDSNINDDPGLGCGQLWHGHGFDKPNIIKIPARTIEGIDDDMWQPYGKHVGVVSHTDYHWSNKRCGLFCCPEAYEAAECPPYAKNVRKTPTIASWNSIIPGHHLLSCSGNQEACRDWANQGGYITSCLPASFDDPFGLGEAVIGPNGEYMAQFGFLDGKYKWVGEATNYTGACDGWGRTSDTMDDDFPEATEIDECPAASCVPDQVPFSGFWSGLTVCPHWHEDYGDDEQGCQAPCEFSGCIDHCTSGQCCCDSEECSGQGQGLGQCTDGCCESTGGGGPNP